MIQYFWHQKSHTLCIDFMDMLVRVLFPFQATLHDINLSFPYPYQTLIPSSIFLGFPSRKRCVEKWYSTGRARYKCKMTQATHCFIQNLAVAIHLYFHILK